MAVSKATEQLLHLIARAKNEGELLREIASLFVQFSKADSADIMLSDLQDELILNSSTVVPDVVGLVRLGKGEGISGQALERGEPLYIESEAFNYPGFASVRGIPDQLCNGAAVLPLHFAGRKYGVVLLRRSKPWTPTAHEKDDLMHFAVAVGASIAAFRNAFRAGGESRTLGALSEVSRVISSSPYLEEILQLLVNFTAQQFNYKVCTVRLLDEASQELVLRATQAQSKGYQRKRAIRLGESIAGRAIATGTSIVVDDVQNDHEYIGHDLAVEQGLRSMICVPLMMHERPVGVMSCYKSTSHEFTPDEVRALETLAGQAAVLIENAKLQVRSTLMQEMHHRVKNNLQQVASLLRLQIRHGGYKTLEQALTDTLSRILAIAAVHDLLSREDLDHVGMRTIAETLVQHQQLSFVLPDKRRSFLVRGDDVHLTTTQATQVALILNELIQNAVEHGFQETAEGEIHVSVEERDGEVGLWVSNNGDKLPAEFNFKNTQSLGLQIVNSLAQSLGGHFKLGDIWGWAVAEVKFQRHGGE